MSRRSLSIAIGGTMAAALLPALLEAAVEDGLATDWNTPALDDDGLEAITNHIEDNGDRPLHLFDEDAKSSDLSSVEAFCRDNGLAYRRMEDPDGGDDGQIRWWSPGMAEPKDNTGDADGDPVVKVKNVVEALNGPNPMVAIRAILDEADAPEVPTFRLG